ncbi:hypothetical protein PVK06_004656 [Gossypium arboreum]|uniref:Uncharacterized protein n=1 Tax=Gossypium arboreum TaxID=29729 RepID=A0ABR0QTX2_GOSAR|nr:hypothetical protein PVK06_004656 [Gossypium arboreum]
MDEDTLMPQFHNLDEAFILKRPPTKGVVFHSTNQDELRRRSVKKVYKSTVGRKDKRKMAVESESNSNKD